MCPATPARLANRLPWRSRSAIAVGRMVAYASRITHLGSGSVIGGKVSLALDPSLLAELTANRPVVLVSATNGKTTTTSLLSAAIASQRPVVSNSLGANMPPGHVAALGPAVATTTAVLEVDERWLPKVMVATHPTVVALLNLSRDQLDRSHEVRKIAAQWRQALGATPPDWVVANADDPLVTWAALGAPRVRWVGTGADWRADAVGCPACSGRLVFAPNDWHCTSCDLQRPEPDLWLQDDDTLAGRDRPNVEIELALPGRVNQMNAAMALATAELLGIDVQRGAGELSSVTDVAGRYRIATVGSSRVRLLLAKNPAGWQEAIAMLAPPPQPVIVAINARIADGHDPSWLWDVPFEQLRGRKVVATGERRHDLAVRLHYAGVDHTIAESLTDAVRAAGAREVDVAANYTAFQEYLAEVGEHG